MEDSMTGTELCPAHLRNEKVPLMTAAALAGVNVVNVWRAIQSGRLYAVSLPAGKTQKHWQVKLGDLAAWAGRPLCARWLAIVEECYGLEPAEEIARVA